MSRHDENQPDAHIEYAIHLRTINLSQPAQGLKESGNGPGVSVDSGAHAIRQDTGQILSDAPARDMRNAFDGKFPQEGENLFGVDSRRREQDFTQRPVQFRQRDC